MSIFFDQDSEEVTEPSQKIGNIEFSIPEGQDKAILCKLVKDVFTGQSCVKYDYFKHKIGGSEQDTRNHACRESLGLGASPEKEFYWDCIGKLKELKELGVTKDDPQYKAVLETKKFFQPKNGGYLFYIEPNSAKFKALKVGPMVFNRLFGREATEWSAAVPSLLTQMKAEGQSPYLTNNPEKNKEGWIKIWRTGKKLATEYHLEPAKIAVQIEHNGKPVTIYDYAKFDLHESINKILSGELELDESTFPNVLEYERKNAWTLDEAENFVEHEGALEGTPERFLKTSAGKDASDNGDKPSSEGSTKEAASSKSSIVGPEDVTDAVSLDEIPF